MVIGPNLNGSISGAAAGNCKRASMLFLFQWRTGGENAATPCLAQQRFLQAIEKQRDMTYKNDWGDPGYAPSITAFAQERLSCEQDRVSACIRVACAAKIQKPDTGLDAGKIAALRQFMPLRVIFWWRNVEKT